MLMTFGYFNLRLVGRKQLWIITYDFAREKKANSFFLIIVTSLSNSCSDF